MAEAQQDASGFIEIRDNKLSKPGVFKYLGKELNGAPDPDAIYHVYRPKEELADPECIESFKLMPWVIEHEMLGKKFKSPAEKKGIHGVIGEKVYYDDSNDFLKGNIKIFSDTLEDAIVNDINELSLGFFCEYDFSETGEYQGQPYNVVQRKIRGNHLASVENSRMDIAVMDHASTAQDHLTVTLQPNEGIRVDKKIAKSNENDKAQPDKKPVNGTGQDADMTMQDMMSMMKEMMPMMKMMQEFMASMNGMNGDMDGDYNKDGDYAMNQDMPDDDGMDQDKDDDNGMDQDKDKKDSGMDANSVAKAIAEAVKPLNQEIARLKQSQSAAMDAASLLGEISKRDALASTLSQFVGTFDHASLDLQGVAEYGVEKLDVPCETGDEISAITAYLHKRQPPTQAALYAITNSTAQDGKTVDNPVDNYLAGGDQ